MKKRLPFEVCPTVIFVVVLVASLFLTDGAFGQAVGDYRTQADGNWTTLGTWQRLNALPGTWATPSAAQGYPGQFTAGPAITIQNGHDVTLDTSPANISSVTFQAGGSTGSVTFAGTNTLTVTGAITINSGNAAGANKTMAVAAGSLSCASVTMATTTNDNRSNSLTVSSGTITVSGNITMNDADPQRNFVNITGAGTLNIGGGLTGGNFTTSAGSTVNYNGGVAQVVRDVNYLGSLTLSGTNTKTWSLGGARTVGGALTVNSTFTIANNQTFGVTGVTDVSGTINLGGNQAKTFSNDVTLNAGSNWNETTAATINFDGDLTNDANSFTANTGTHNFNGAGGIVSGATTTSIPSANFSGSYTNNGTFASSTTLTITNPAVLTNNGTITASGNMAGVGGLVQGATGVLNVGGTSTVALTATAVGNTVNFTGGAGQTVISTNYYNLGLAGTGAKNLQGGTTTIAGDLTLSGTATTSTVVNLDITGNLIIGDGTSFTAANTTLGVTGTTTVGGGTGGTLAISSATGTKTFNGDVTLNSGSTWNESAAATVNIGGNFTNNAGTFTASTGTHTFTGASKVLSGSTTTLIPNTSVSGTYTNTGTLTASTTLGGGGTLTQGASGALIIGGTSTITNLNATAAGNSVEYQGGAQTVKATNYYDLTLSGTGAKTLGAGTTSIGGDFTLSGTASTTAVTGLSIGGFVTLGAGTSFTAGGFTHNVTGDWSNNGGAFVNAGSTINFNGADQSIGGSSSTTFNNLSLSGSGIKTISTNPTINGNFTLSGTASTSAIAAMTVGGTVTLGAGTTFTAGPYTHNVAGNWINNGGNFSNAGSTINFNGAAQAIGGTSPTTFNNVTLAGTNTKTFGIGSVTADRFTINTGVIANLGTFAHTTNTLRFATVAQAAGTWGGTGSAATNINSTFFAAATGILTVAVLGSTTYYSRQTGNWNLASTWSTVGYGNATNTGTFPVAGDIVNIGGGNFTITVPAGNSAACTIISFLGGEDFDQSVSLFNATSSLNVSGTINIVEGDGFGDSNVIAVGAGTLTAGSIAFSNGGLFPSYALTISTGTATVSGNVTQSGVGSAIVTFTNSGLLRVGGDLPNATFLTPSTGTVEYFGSGSQNVSSLVLSSYNNLTLSGTGTKTAGGDTDINGVFTLAAGTTFVGGPNTYTLAGNWVNNGATFTNTNFTVTLDGGAQSIGGSTATTFNNLTLSNGTKTFSLVTTVNGQLSINSGALANLGSITTHFARTLALNGAGQVAGSWGSTASAATNKNNTYFTAGTTGILNVSNRAYFSRASGIWNANGTWSTVDYGNATNAGTFPVAGDIANIGGNNYTITVGVPSACGTLNFEGNGGNDCTVSLTSSLTVSGAINMPNGGFGGSNTLAVGTGTLNAGSIEFSTDGLFGIGPHSLTISTGSATISGNVSQSGSSNATITFTNNGQLTLGGAFLNSGNCTFTASTGTVNYVSSTVAQTIGDFTYNNLVLNNTSGAVPQLTLYDDATVSGTLTMTAGIINLNSATLRLGTAVTSVATIGSLVYTNGWMYGGTFRRYFTENTAVTLGTVNGHFPLGTSTNYRPLFLGKPSLANTGGALNVSHNGNDNGSTGVTIVDDNGTITVRSNSFWTVSKALGMAGSGTPYSIEAGGTGFGVVQEVDDLRLSQASSEVGTTSLPNAGTTSSPLVKKINISNANLARNYYIGSVDATNSPLPIELINFTAKLNNDVVFLNWATASELNNDYFVIERAVNIEEFEQIGEPIDGAGTTKVRRDYTTMDETPVYGRSYYRLKQTDFDGKSTYSEVRVIDYEGPKFATLRVYPNPSDGHTLTVLLTGLKEQSSVPVQIFNVQGQKVYENVLDVSNPGSLKYEIEFNGPLRSGIYLIKAGQTLQLTQKIFIE